MEGTAFRQQRTIFAPMTMGQSDEANAAVTMLPVVLGDKIRHPELRCTHWSRQLKSQFKLVRLFLLQRNAAAPNHP